MTQLNETDRASSHLEKAIEASCVALVSLELISSCPGDASEEIRIAQSEVRKVIELLRAALAELRLEGGEAQTALAFGFVMGAVPEWPSQRPEDQLKPRRTA
jgi:hypothetical protein